jgi:shikimate kinase
MKTNVALIGFMGVGKSVVSLVLARKLGKKRVEVDSWLVQRTGKSISQIFQEKGEIAFREMEIEAIKDIVVQDNQVIDCGGGVPLNKINIDRLKQKAVIVWLRASPEVIAQRTSTDNHGRPLLDGVNRIDDIARLMKQRQSYYASAADVKIDTSRQDAVTISERIVGRLKKNADFS